MTAQYFAWRGDFEERPEHGRVYMVGTQAEVDADATDALLVSGDRAWAEDTEKLYVATDASTWVEIPTGPGGGGGGVTDHGALTGLGDDDHPQYHNDARGDLRYWPLSTDLATQAELDTHKASADHDARYYTETETDTLLAAKQAADADLTAIAGLDSSTAGAIASDGAGWIKKTYAQFKTALGLVKGDVGLGNVDNTSDANKPVSTAQQAALDLKAPNSPDFLVGTADAGLSSEIVVGTSPGGELGGTWASPTVDATHSGTSHAGIISTHEAASDPHTAYQKESEKSANNGYASLDGSGDVPRAELSAAVAYEDEANVFTASQKIQNTDADPVLTFERLDSGASAVGDVALDILGKAEDSAGNSTTYGEIKISIGDETDGSEDGRVEVFERVAGTATRTIRITQDKIWLMRGGTAEDTNLYSPSADNLKTDDAFAAALLMSARSTQADTLIPAGYAAYVPGGYEIAAAHSFEIAATAVFEIG